MKRTINLDKEEFISAPYPLERILGSLDYVCSLLHRYNFALLSERDAMVQRAYRELSDLNLDLCIANLDVKSEDVCATGR